MLGDEPDEIAEDGLTLAFRELVILGQPRRQMLEGDGTARFGGTCRCHCLSCARRRHDGLPSSEARKCASGRRYDSRLDGKSLCAPNAANRGSFGAPETRLQRGSADRRPSSLRFELSVPPLQRRLEAVSAPDLLELPADLGGCRVERGHHVEPGLQGIAE